MYGLSGWFLDGFWMDGWMKTDNTAYPDFSWGVAIITNNHDNNNYHNNDNNYDSDNYHDDFIPVFAIPV